MKSPLILFCLAHWHLSFIDFCIRQSHIYINMFLPVLYNYWWRITSFGSTLVKKETRMFYIAKFITLSVVMELLLKFTLLIHYKLSRFRTPQVNKFDIRALLFGSYARFVPLDKMVFYGYWKTLPSGSYLMLHIDFLLFSLCNGLCCSLSNYYLNNYNNVLHYVCFHFCFRVWNYIISLAPNYWINIWPICHVTSVRKF